MNFNDAPTMKTTIFTTCMLLATLFCACNFSKRNQRQELDLEINRVLKDKKATVGVAVLTGDTLLALHNNQVHFPLFSVFKFHVALAVLNKMDKGDICLDSLVEIKAAQMHPNTYSPLRQKFPDCDFSISLRELLKYSISLSDNNACDILIDYVGGIAKVSDYIKSLGLNDFALAANEDLMHTDRAALYRNWSTPEAVVRLFDIADKQPLFAAEYKDFLWQTLKETSTGADKLKAQLPSDAIIGHKTGSSDRTSEGIKTADNDAGFVILPDGRKYYIAVLIMESQETDRENAAIIARISRIVYDYFSKF